MKSGKVGYLSMMIKKSDLASMSGQELRQLIEDANTILHVKDKHDEMQHKMETALQDLFSKMSSYAYDYGCTVYIVMNDGLSYDVDNLMHCSVEIQDNSDVE